MGKRRTLTEELAELERTNPEVRAAAENLDRVTAEIVAAKPPLILKHGNGYRILSAVSDAMAKAKWSYADGRAWLKRARRLTYEELLEACHRDFSVTIASSFSTEPRNWVADDAKPEELELIPE